jgi:hypothetical protein
VCDVWQFASGRAECPVDSLQDCSCHQLLLVFRMLNSSVNGNEDKWFVTTSQPATHKISTRGYPWPRTMKISQTS